MIGFASDMSAVGDFMGLKKLGSSRYPSPTCEMRTTTHVPGSPQGEFTIEQYRQLDMKTLDDRHPATRVLEDMVRVGEAVVGKVKAGENAGAIAPPFITHGDVYWQHGAAC